MKISLLYFVMLFQLLRLDAQTTRFGFETGIGSFQMTDLKNEMIRVIQTNTLQPKVVSNFPNYVYFQPSITLCNNNRNWGISLTLISTGARASIRDYSGEYRYDNNVIGYGTSWFEELRFYNDKKFSLYFHSDLGLLYSNLNLNEYFRIYNQVYTNEC